MGGEETEKEACARWGRGKERRRRKQLRSGWGKKRRKKQASDRELDKIFPLNFPNKLYRILSSINFLLLLVTTSSPLLLRFKVTHGSFINGWWTVCDGYSCNAIVSASGSLAAARVLAIGAAFSGFVALISAWSLLTRVMGREIDDNLISSMAHFSSGLFLLCALLITFYSLRVKIEIYNNNMRIYAGFYIGCFVCFLSFLLGTMSLLYHKGLMKEKENVISVVNAAAPEDLPQSDSDQPTV